jgi:cyclic pyranopterin phosphate synthase
MPEEGMVWLEKAELLSFEEMSRLARIFAGLGVSKIRLTGGEPLMRKDLYLLVEKIARIDGISDLALTTNGFFLADQALNLFKAGLRRINISLDSLDPAKFAQMTRRNYFDRVWRGIEAVENLGITPIKLNVVLMRGVNDNEIPHFAHLARSKPFVIRFIEFMPIGSDDGWSMEQVVPSKEIIENMERYVGRKLVPVEYHGAQPADRYRFEDGLGEIGFISSVSEPFCGHCNRIRITSDGKLRTCLFSLTETDLKSMLRTGASDEDIREQLVSAVWNKEEGHLINRPGFVRPSRTMSQIGG